VTGLPCSTLFEPFFRAKSVDGGVRLPHKSAP
jgi:hypothetical protein